jgi:hypothetical protein
MIKVEVRKEKQGERKTEKQKQIENISFSNQFVT